MKQEVLYTWFKNYNNSMNVYIIECSSKIDIN